MQYTEQLVKYKIKWTIKILKLPHNHTKTVKLVIQLLPLYYYFNYYLWSEDGCYPKLTTIHNIVRNSLTLYFFRFILIPWGPRSQLDNLTIFLLLTFTKLLPIIWNLIIWNFVLNIRYKQNTLYESCILWVLYGSVKEEFLSVRRMTSTWYSN